MKLDKMDHMPAVAAVMTPFPQAVELDTPLERARKVMAKHRIHHLPVLADGEVTGLLAAGDLPRPGSETGHLRVGDVCDRDPCVVAITAPLDDVLERMVRERRETVLVVKEDRLAGILTLNDACQLFVELLRRLLPKTTGGDDAA